MLNVWTPLGLRPPLQSRSGCNGTWLRAILDAEASPLLPHVFRLPQSSVSHRLAPSAEASLNPRPALQPPFGQPAEPNQTKNMVTKQRSGFKLASFQATVMQRSQRALGGGGMEDGREGYKLSGDINWEKKRKIRRQSPKTLDKVPSQGY